MQVAEWLTAPLYYTRPEVEGFGDQTQTGCPTLPLACVLAYVIYII